MSARLASALASALLLAACGDAPAPGASTSASPAKPTGEPPAEASKPPAPTSDGPSAAAGELAWEAPASFKKVANPSTMRKATYEAPKVGSDPEAPTLSVIVAGGGVDANIDRWATQFDEAAKPAMRRDAKKVGSYDVTVVELKGTFSGGGGMMGAPTSPQAGWALLGAVVPVGDQQWFFKMTGPEASVAAARADFDKLVDSFHPAP